MCHYNITDEAFKSMYQSIMMKIKNSDREDWLVETIVKHSIKIFEKNISRKNSIEKWR